MLLTALLGSMPLTQAASSTTAAWPSVASQITFGVSERQGRRLDQEDRVVTGNRIYAVLDGHGGDHTSDYASVKIESLNQAHRSLNASQRWFKIINDLESGLRQANAGNSGSTQIGAIIENGVATVANLGDSRAVQIRNGQVVNATSDHKPSDRNEKERIENAGGFVIRGRINGDLAVSRALGDFRFKVPNNQFSADLVSSVPDISLWALQPGDYLVLACDGLWDKLSNEEVAQIVLSYSTNTFADLVPVNEESTVYYNERPMPEEEQYKEVGNQRLIGIARELRDESYDKGSNDNITVMVINYMGQAGVVTAAMQKESEAASQAATAQLDAPVVKRPAPVLTEAQRRSIQEEFEKDRVSLSSDNPLIRQQAARRILATNQEDVGLDSQAWSQLITGIVSSIDWNDTPLAEVLRNRGSQVNAIINNLIEVGFDVNTPIAQEGYIGAGPILDHLAGVTKDLDGYRIAYRKFNDQEQEAIKKLIEKMANVSQESLSSLLVTFAQDKEMLQYLIDHGANVNHNNRSELATPLISLVLNYLTPSITGYYVLDRELSNLLAIGANPFEKNNQNKTARAYASVFARIADKDRFNNLIKILKEAEEAQSNKGAPPAATVTSAQQPTTCPVKPTAIPAVQAAAVARALPKPPAVGRPLPQRPNNVPANLSPVPVLPPVPMMPTIVPVAPSILQPIPVMPAIVQPARALPVPVSPAGRQLPQRPNNVPATLSPVPVLQPVPVMPTIVQPARALPIPPAAIPLPSGIRTQAAPSNLPPALLAALQPIPVMPATVQPAPTLPAIPVPPAAPVVSDKNYSQLIGSIVDQADVGEPLTTTNWNFGEVVAVRRSDGSLKYGFVSHDGDKQIVFLNKEQTMSKLLLPAIDSKSVFYVKGRPIL